MKTWLWAFLIMAGLHMGPAQATVDCEALAAATRALYTEGAALMPLHIKAGDLRDQCPKHPDGYLYGALVFYHEQEPNGALHFLNEGIAQLPDNFDLYRMKARFQNEWRQPQAATATFQALIQNTSRKRDAHVLLAYHLLQMNDLKGAAENFEKARSIGPANVDLYTGLAAYELQAKAPDKAIVQVRKALELEPHATNPIFYRAEAYRQLGYCELAQDNLLRACERAKRGNCQNVCAPAKGQDEVYELQRQGLRAFSAGKLDEADQLLTQALQAFQADPGLYNYRAWVRERQGKLDEALADVQKALQLDPGHEAGWFRLGHIQHGRKQYTEAIKAYRQNLWFLPNNTPQVYQNLALIYNDLQDFPAALREAEQAIALAPPEQQASMLEVKGYIQQQSGQLEAALITINQALAKDPEHFFAHKDRAEILTQLKRCKEAEADYAFLCKQGDKSACTPTCKP